jgi:hypothetical protein
LTTDHDVARPGQALGCLLALAVDACERQLVRLREVLAVEAGDLGDGAVIEAADMTEQHADGVFVRVLRVGVALDAGVDSIMVAGPASIDHWSCRQEGLAGG